MLGLFLPTAILLTASLLVISSVSVHLFWLQLVWLIFGLGLIFLFVRVDWRFILNYRWLIGGLYVFAILLLVFVYFTGPVVRNVKSWIVFGPFNFQPVELVKVALILLYANYFSRRHLSIARWKNILTSFLFFIAPAAVAVMLPDLGSAVIFFGIWFGFLLLLGLPFRRILVVVLIFALAAGFVWTHVLKDYHRARILGFLYPSQNLLGVNYSVTQSKIAIGSAGFWGKGYKQGSEVRLGFLTEPASDFPLAALVEEWGVFGGLVVIVSFLALIVAILRIGVGADRNFEKFICLGVAIVFGLQFLLNTGSELGLMPVVGVTFPFLSYGGSSLVANFFLLSIINAIRRK